jgi:hypothetical protein
MNLLWLCIASDKDSASSLAQTLGVASSSSVYVLEGSSKLDWPALQQRGQQPVFLWTPSSVLESNTGLIAAAVSAQRRGRYIGVLQDTATTPNAVKNANELRLRPGFGLTEKKSIPAFGKELARLAKAKRGLNHYIYELIANLNWWAKALGLGVAVSGFLAIIQAFPMADNFVCSPAFMERPCKAVGWGDFPSEAEQTAWETIKTSSDCAKLAEFIDRFGPEGILQSKVQESLNTARSVTGTRGANIPSKMPISVSAFRTLAPQGPIRDRELDQALDTAANERCKSTAIAFGATFKSVTSVRSPGSNCVEDKLLGAICFVQGTMTCIASETITGEQCQPPEDF